MAFDDMPDRGPLTEPGIAEFAELALRLSKDAVDKGNARLDVSYGKGLYQKLDVFLPARMEGQLPVLMFMHGGGWRHGFKEWMGYLAPVFNSLPAIFVAPNYRLAPENKYPAGLNDCRLALEWVYTNIGAFGGDPQRIFVGGHSAGGHYAALMTLKLNRSNHSRLPSGLIKGCFPVSAPLELRLGYIEPGSRRENLAKDLLEDSLQGVDATPESHVAGNATPFLLCWGGKDVPAIVKENKALYEALRKQPGGCERLELADCGHFDTIRVARNPDSAWLAKVRMAMSSQKR